MKLLNCVWDNCIFWVSAYTFRTYRAFVSMCTGECHRVEVMCSTFFEVLGELWWGGMLPYMTAHISLVYDLWPCPLSSLVACDCTVAQSATPLLLSLSASLSVPSSLALFPCSASPPSLSPSLCPLCTVAHRGPWAPPFSAWGALLCTCDIGGMCVCGHGRACVWLCFRPCEGSHSYDFAEESHLQLCLKQQASRCRLPRCHTICHLLLGMRVFI